MAGLKVKKGDTVQVIAGKDKGTTGKVIEVRENGRVVVEGVGRVKRHLKAGQPGRGAQQGGILTQEAAVHASNVQLVDPTDGRPTRVGYKVVDGRKVRYSRRTGEEI